MAKTSIATAGTLEAPCPDTLEGGNKLAREYFQEYLRTPNRLGSLNYLKDMFGRVYLAYGDGEGMRGLIEGLHERYEAAIREPDVRSPSVQKRLGDALEAVKEATYVMEGIQNAASERIEDATLFSVIEYAAKHGDRVLSEAQALIEAVQEHRAEVANG